MSDLVDQKLMLLRTAAEAFKLEGPDSILLKFNPESGLCHIGGRSGIFVMTAGQWAEYQKLCERWKAILYDLEGAPGISMLVVEAEEEAKFISETRLRPGDEVFPEPPKGGTTNGLSREDLRRIYHALLVSVLEVRTLVAGASTAMSVEDYGDALCGASRRLELMESCIRGLLGSKAEIGKQKAEIQETTCPACKDPLIFPRDSSAYCENCGWPDEVRPAQEDEGGVA